MEVLAQWLDDLEDLLVATALVAEQVRWRCLQLGLVASLALLVILLSSRALAWASLCAGVAAVCVALWCLAVLGSGMIGRGSKPQPA